MLALLLAGCGGPATAPAQKSPDGTMTLTTSVNQRKSDATQYLCVIVDITDSTGKTLYHNITPASDVQRWSVQWVSSDEVLLKSSDVGNYNIRRKPDGTWQGELSGR